MTDPAVRSIQIASTLIDRLGELIRPRVGSQLAATVGSLAADNLELRVGEAQQIAPEIWNHLDDARRVLVGRGIDVADYDDIRRTQSPAMLATSNIEVKRKLDLLGLVHGEIKFTETKNVQWDAAGFVRGLAASLALKAKLPEVDWVALDLAERREIDAAGSLKSAKWKSTAMWVGLAAGVAVIAIVIYVAFGRGDSPDAEAAAAKQREKDALIVRAKAERKAKIEEWSAKLAASPCDPAVKEKLISYLLADRQTPTANVVELAFVDRCSAVQVDAAP